MTTAKMRTAFSIVLLVHALPSFGEMPKSIGDFALGDTISDVETRVGSELALDISNDSYLADGRCGWETFRVDLQGYHGEELIFVDGHLIAIRLKKHALLTAPEVYALAERFADRYGPPTYFLCGDAEHQSIDRCEYKTYVGLNYERGIQGERNRYEFSIAILEESHHPRFVQGYSLNMHQGFQYHLDRTRSCRERAFKEVQREKAESITIP
jgi:hypothetical protein